jgi:hypothetical protein
LKRAEDVRFALRHEEAVAIVLAASQHSWPAAAWFLERSAPGRWALKNNVVRGDPEQDKELEDPLPAEVLQCHRNLLLEQAREDEARQAANATSELAVEQTNQTSGKQIGQL